MDVFSNINDIAKQLGVSPSTIKKYYLAIEKQGFRFRRNQQGRVMLSSDDVKLIRAVMQIKNEEGETIETAVTKILSSITGVTVITDEEIHTEPETSIDVTVMTEEFDKMKELLLKQQEQINQLLEEQQSNKKLLETDVNSRDKKFMELTREIQEVKKMIAADQEKTFWQRLFNK